MNTMTLEQDLRDLVKRWKSEAAPDDALQDYDTGSRDGTEICADELLQILDAHLREREAAMTAVTAVTEELAIEAGKAIAARFSEGFFDQRMVVECGRAALEAVAPMLASAMVPDDLTF